jgi:SAM-dependent methyltransferase
MNKIFQEVKDDYRKEIAKAAPFFIKDIEFYTKVKADIFLQFANKFFGNSISNLKVLDAGCGVGLTDVYLTKVFDSLYGIELFEELVEVAQKRNPKVEYKQYDGMNFPFKPGSMDLVFSSMVIHHIPLEYRLNFFEQISMVLSDNGYAVIFECNPYNPVTRYSVKKCKLDEGAVLITAGEMKKLAREAGLKVVKSSYFLFFPFRGPVFRWLESFMWWLPMGAQHFLVLKK